MPEGFNSKIFIYGWFKRNGNWHPREVDELYIDELEWIPIYEQAIDEATEYISSMMKHSSPNQH
jgi:hypothetical protein